MSPHNIALYLRISKSDERSTSIDKQRRNCRRLAHERFPGARLEEFVDDGASATKARPRPAYVSLLSRLGEFDAVVIDTQDRIARKPLDFWQFAADAERHNAVILGASEDLDLSTAEGEMTAGIRLTVARAEARRTGQRIRATNQLRAARGQRALGGPAPFGLVRHGESFRPHPENAPVVLDAIRRIMVGELTERGWAEELTRNGVPTPRGAASWPHRTVSKLLRNPTLAGMVPHQGDVLRDDDGMPRVDPDAALVDMETWEELQAVLRARSVPFTRYKKNLPLLHGLAMDHHDHRLYAHRIKGRRDRYTCRYVGCPSKTSVDMERLDKLVSERVLALVGRAEELREVVVEPSGDPGRLASVRAQIQATTAALADARDPSTIGSLAERLSRLRAAESDAEAVTSVARTEMRPTGRTVLEAYRAAQSDDERRHILMGPLLRVAVYPGQRGGQYRDISDRVQFVWRWEEDDPGEIDLPDDMADAP